MSVTTALCSGLYSRTFIPAVLSAVALALLTQPCSGQVASEVLKATGIDGGLVVHLGTTDGQLEVSLAGNPRFLVHGLSANADSVAAAREQIDANRLWGRVVVEPAASVKNLPYAADLVNLLIADLDFLGADGPSAEEIQRVLAPGGVSYVRRSGKWKAAVKPRPAGTDEWTHLNHGPDGNPVSRDRLVENPYGLKWITSKVMGWGMFSVRSTNGRVFLFWDTLIQWVDKRTNMIKVEARDAYSSVLLWEEYYPFPEKERTRPVAVGDRVFMLSGTHAISIDATNGKVIKTFRECETPFDTLVSDGVLVCRNDEALFGFDAESGKLLWRRASIEHPDVLARYAKRRKGHFEPGWRRQLLVVGDGRVYFADHTSNEDRANPPRVLGLDVRTGKQTFAADGEHVGEFPHPCFHTNGVLMLTNENGFSGCPTGKHGQPWTIDVFGWKDSRRRLFRGHSGIGISGFLAVDGLVWIKDRQKQRLSNDPFASPEDKPFKGWIGVDPLSGQIKRRIYYPSKESWSGRCYADVAVPGRIFAENMEIIDLDKGTFANFRAARGQCGSGFIFADGSIYTAPMRCVSCYPMLRGATKLCGETDRGIPVEDAERLQKGTGAFSRQNTLAAAEGTDESSVPPSSTVRSGRNNEWPMYRHGPARTNTTPTPSPVTLSRLWSAQFERRTSAPVIAAGRVYVAVVNEGRICALDARSGHQVWSFAASSRIDTPPTIHEKLCLFGSHDGYIYCLNADNGDLLWRYNAAPEQRRIVAYDRVESPWPVMGSVLVHDGVAYAVAGRLTRVDGGMYLVALDPATGRTIWRQHLKGIYGDEAHVLPQSWYVHEEHMTNNLLLAKGNAVRLYDEFGTWQFNVKDGRLEGRSSDVPQPGWPKGRRTPYNEVASERWTWCGWDRVTAAELLAGEDTYNSMAHGMQPYTRNTPKYEAWLFPDRNRWGINGIRKNKEKQFVLQPAKFTERHLEPDKMPWKPRVLDLDVKSYAFVKSGDTLLVAGGTPVGPIHRGGELRMISMANGRDRAVARLPAAPIFDGVAAAYGRIFVSTVDGQLVCLGDVKATDEATQMRSASAVNSQRLLQ